ncbi:Hydramacin-1 [Folsomia candida]|uniref:Hydramacin-1 n=1 Tax=Folsomia candida TaxID=158441 RepID=A0A226CXP5_FOLCA|nr:Hydramacin-1 [Folsomia candida]
MNRTTFRVTLIILAFGVIFPNLTESASCYEAWSRCTGWSSGATGILWKTCAGRCQQCQGRASGSCVPVKGDCGARSQCQCSGRNVPKSTNPLDIATCFMGL